MKSLKKESVGMEICFYKDKLEKIEEIVQPLKGSEYEEV